MTGSGSPVLRAKVVTSRDHFLERIGSDARVGALVGKVGLVDQIVEKIGAIAAYAVAVESREHETLHAVTRLLRSRNRRRGSHPLRLKALNDWSQMERLVRRSPVGGGTKLLPKFHFDAVAIEDPGEAAIILVLPPQDGDSGA